MCKVKSACVMTVLGVGLAVSVSFAALPSGDAGKKLYDSKCASCHGKNGKGNPAMSKAFKVDPKALDLTSEGTVKKTDEELLKIISDGRNKMPGYGKQLKEEERKVILQYFRDLSAKK